jgi:hypothetical protein
VLGGWVAARGLFLAPVWLSDEAAAEPIGDVAALPTAPRLIRVATSKPGRVQEARTGSLKIKAVPDMRPEAVKNRTLLAAYLPGGVAHETALSRVGREVTPGSFDISESGAAPLPTVDSTAPALAKDWSLSAWAFVRRGVGPQLATGGMLGGSQIGARLSYRVRDRLGVTARIYSPLANSRGAEAALGLEWQPLRSLPVRILAERRQAIGRDGRSAFAVQAHGGVSERRVIGPVRLDAYGQAGMVGTRSRDAFVDGAARLGIPADDRIGVGVGAWGAAQPGVARLDLGPEASYRLPELGMRISASYRVRVAGDARPGSGPALTLSSDF